MINTYMSANEMRKLMETVENLNEYIVREGEPFSSILHLNGFSDLVGDEPIEDMYPDINFKKWPEFGALRKAAEIVKRRVELQSVQGRLLTAEEVDEIEGVWYDGGDAYEHDNAAGIKLDLFPLWKDHIQLAFRLLKHPPK